jgi:hypothetical protein
VIPTRRLVRWRRALLSARAVLCCVWALALTPAGCSNSTRLPAPFIFNTPGDVALACFDQEPDGDERVVLPLHCCASDAQRRGCPEDSEHRLRHALVTQTARGEVAAIDLDNVKVLDSERRVPGYTFVDVGGLPAAIVVPGTFPGRDEFGPPWTYVAGREVSSIRAIATCRFRVGATCGPELEIDESVVPAHAQTEIPLPEAPQDMLLDPGGKALWVSLPKAGRIARIDLGQLGAGPTEPGAPPPFVAPFATDDAGTLPRPPTYFPVPSGINLKPLEPVAIPEEDEYRSWCGTDYDVVTTQPKLPLAPRAESSQRALPTRLRLLPAEPVLPAEPGGISDALLPLLFVADVGQAVLHAFAIVDGELQQRAVLPVGAQLRDFVLTAPVPSKAPDFDALVDPERFAYETPPVNDKRYLFGIDSRDGSVMLFDLSFSGETPALTPLEAPVPARYEVDIRRHARDRLLFDGASARTLEIVDTRYRELAEWAASDELYQEKRDALYCGKTPNEQLDEAIDGEENKANKELLEEVRDWSELGQRSDVLRGVFLIVASSEGRLSVMDVHDLNLQCRARAGCVQGADQSEHNEDSSAAALALRRHARRVLTAERAQPLVTSGAELVSFPGGDGEEADAGAREANCPDGYYQPADNQRVCVVSDPWQTRNLEWAVLYEGSTSTVPNALLEREGNADQITLWGPQAWDFCARGANVGDQLKVAVISVPDPDIRDCQTYSRGSEPELFVVEAYRDHLVLVPRAAEPEPDEDAGGEEPPAPEMDAGAPDGDGGAGASDGGADADAAMREADLDELMRCYPSFLNAEIRLHDQFLVSHTSGVYLHRNQADESGACVVNEELDPRLTSRISGPDWVFQDFALAFKLDVSDSPEELAPVVRLTLQSNYLGILNVDTSSGRADALPSRVRFFLGTEDLFVVDGASQGLRRYQLEPFRHDGSRFR